MTSGLIFLIKTIAYLEFGKTCFLKILKFNCFKKMTSVI